MDSRMEDEMALDPSRRNFLKRSTAAAAIAMAPGVLVKAAENHLDVLVEIRFAVAVEIERREGVRSGNERQ